MTEDSLELLTTKISNAKQYISSNFATEDGCYQAIQLIADSEVLMEILRNVS